MHIIPGITMAHNKTQNLTFPYQIISQSVYLPGPIMRRGSPVMGEDAC